MVSFLFLAIYIYLGWWNYFVGNIAPCVMCQLRNDQLAISFLFFILISLTTFARLFGSLLI